MGIHDCSCDSKSIIPRGSLVALMGENNAGLRSINGERDGVKNTSLLIHSSEEQKNSNKKGGEENGKKESFKKGSR